MSKDDFNELYNKNWEAKNYMEGYYNGTCFETEFYMTQYYNAFTKVAELVGRDQNKRNILELGCGPCVCYGAAAVAAGYSKNKSITYSDFVENNWDAITNWVEKADGAGDWSGHFKFLANLSGKSASEIEDGTRKTFKEVLPCDVRQPSVPVKGSEKKYDIVITNLCLEAACPNVKEWAAALNRVSNMMTSGGILLMGGIGGLKTYPVGDTDFPAATIDKDVINNLFVKDKILNFDLIDVHWTDLDQTTAKADSDSLFFVVAKKNS